MKFLRNSLVGLIVYLAMPASIFCLIFIMTDSEAGKMASTYEELVHRLDKLQARLIDLSSSVASAAEQPAMPPVPIEKTSSVVQADPAATSSVEEDSDINKIPLEFDDLSFSIDDILEDRLNLIPTDFKIPPVLKKRVAFWFDIYGKYSSHFVLIHDANHPWLVYKVVDLRDIYAKEGNRFTKDANDRRAVSKARWAIKTTLARLAKRRTFQHLNEEEYRIYKILEEVPGSRKKVFNQALHSVRDQRGQKDFYRKGLMSSSRYLNQMEQIFASYDLPIELTRLPLVESSFNLAAQSKVGASGIWQFMLGTGKHYLTVGRIADERNSPLKATEAAAKLMLSNFRITHSWPLAITAYNHGAGGVIHAAHALHTNSIADIVTKYHSRSFSFASQNFYSEFLAALYGEKYQDRVFGPSLRKYPPLETETIDLRYSMRAKILTDIVGMTVEELKLYNPDLKAQAIAKATFLPVGYHIHLPVGRKARLELFYQQADEARAILGSSKKVVSRPQRHG